MKKVAPIAFLLSFLLVITPAFLQHWTALPAAVSAQPQTAILRPDSPATKKPATSAVETEDSKAESSSFSRSIKGSQKLKGLFTLYRNAKTGRVLAEIRPDQLNQNYLNTVTLESGIGESGLYSGLPLGDFLFYFQRINNNLQLTVRNVNFRTDPGNPIQRSLNRSFSDSVLSALPIRAIHPQRKTLLVDLSPLLLGDFPGIGSYVSAVLRGSYTLDSSKTYLGPAKAFPQNVELESVYNFSGSGADVETLPDDRALTLRVRYSFSQLPENKSYRPRLADDRIGYFITAYQDFSNDNQRDPFVRYINRWHLEKQDPSAALSPPKQPIVFWIENTVPLEYRNTVREGVLMWNQAFEKIGFKDAIEVKQMPDRAEWDPADVRYNVIRWFNSFDATFAMGPSRVNPLTGQILDADIIVSADFVRSIKQEYRIFAEQNRSQSGASFAQQLDRTGLCTDRRFNPETFKQQSVKPEVLQSRAAAAKLLKGTDICYGMESVKQLSAGALTLSFLQNATPNGTDMKEYVHQFLRQLIAHEIGHTLGLRHNFHASAMLMPQELNNTEITHAKGLVSSVMDYNPPNLAPKGVKQGDYFTTVVGPYDEWAIAYGYTPVAAMGSRGELRTLEKIAGRSPEPDLSYATDEDLYSFLDPEVNAFDLSGDVLTYSQTQMDISRSMWDRLEKRYPVQGESYSEAREAFDTIFFSYFMNATNLPQYIGGQSFSRNRKGDPGGTLPFELVPVDKQRQALAVLQKYVFDETAFQFSPNLLNRLAPSRWSHWGSYIPIFRLDYPIHDRIFLLQSLVLSDVLSGDRLNRLRDAELKSKPGQALTIPELFDTLQAGIWKEVVNPESKPVQSSSLRRALQRDYMNTLTTMVLRLGNAPEDARTIARYKLRQLRDALSTSLRRQDLDTYTRAHFEESRDRISKALDAQLQSG